MTDKTGSMTDKAGSTLRGVLVLLVITSPLGCAAILAVAMLSPAVQLMLETLAAIFPYLLTAAAVIVLLYALGFTATDIVRRWHLRHVVFPTLAGMFPLVKGQDWFDATPDAVKAVAAWTHAQAANGVKPQSKSTQAAISAALYGQPQPSTPALYPAPPALPEPTCNLQPATFNLDDIDPLTRPHWLLVGQTGSGKSTAVRTITTELTRRHAVEFVICEPGGVDWNSQANAYSDQGIARAVSAVYAEFERRQALLRDADAPHISRLPQRLPYLYLIVEEMEAVLDNLKDLNRDAALNMRVQLRNIARMGRKEGVGLIAVTQVAKADVFDTHVRSNLANVFLFRNAQTVAEMFRLGRQVDLPSLAPGVAYSLAHERLIQFAPVPRPTLPLSPIYHEDGIQPVATGWPSHQPQPAFLDVQPVVSETASHTLIDRGRAPTAAEAAEMRLMYQRGASLNSLCARFYGYKDQVVLNYVREATGYETR